jgi:cytochrome c-type biogenesis protein CcmH/NrfF
MMKFRVSSFQFPAKRRVAQVVLVASLAVLLLGAGDDARFNDLGHRLMCTCGCSQVLLECNHVGCTASDGMRKELLVAMNSGKSDDQILNGFVDKYGMTVLAAPTKSGFNLVAWIMPFAILALATLLTVWIVRRWKSGLQPADAHHEPLPLPALEELRARARKETEL